MKSTTSRTKWVVNSDGTKKRTVTTKVRFNGGGHNYANRDDTVGKLLKVLQQHPAGAEVYILDDEDYNFLVIEGSEITAATPAEIVSAKQAAERLVQQERASEIRAAANADILSVLRARSKSTVGEAAASTKPPET